jgi:hypothetical protein
MVIYFYYKFYFFKKETSHNGLFIKYGVQFIMICLLNAVYNWPNKVPQKLLDKKLNLCSIHACLQSSICHKIVPSTFKD